MSRSQNSSERKGRDGPDEPGGGCFCRSRLSASVHAPELIDLEFASALRSLSLGRRIGEDRLRLLAGDYLDLPIRLHSHRSLLPRIIELRQNFSSYDAAYVALAERVGALFVTADAALGRAARRHTEVEVLIP